MRFSVFCGVSVDGFIAREDDTLDFLDAGGNEPHGFTEFMNTVDVPVQDLFDIDVLHSAEAWARLRRLDVVRACEGISASRRLLIWRYGIVPFAVEFMT